MSAAADTDGSGFESQGAHNMFYNFGTPLLRPKLSHTAD
jgi:hypothetical protein